MDTISKDSIRDLYSNRNYYDRGISFLREQIVDY